MKDKRKNNTYKYFIYSINEYFNDDYSKLDNRKFDSIVQLLDDYIDLFQRVKSENNSKLEKSMNALIDDILFFLKNTFLKKSDCLLVDIKQLIKLLSNEENRKTKATYYNILSFRNKLRNMKLIEIYIDVLVNDISNYDDADILADCLVSELLHMGYSVEYLRKWWITKFNKEELQQQDITSQVLKFKELNVNNTHDFSILICLRLPIKLEKEIQEKNELCIEKITYIKSDERDKFPKIKDIELVLKTTIKACDKYKAIEKAVYPIERYIQVYKVQDSFIDSKTIKSCYVISETEDEYIEMHNRKNNIRALSYREKEDIIDFIDLRDKIRIENGTTSNLVDIENVVNILQKCPEFTKENRLLNLWSSMENILRFYDAGSIIVKVTDIVPKIITMYLLKQKMNQLWERLSPIVKNNSSLFECSIEDKTKKYDRDKFLTLLLDEEKSLKLYRDTSENILIQKSVLEIHNYFKEEDKLKDMVDLLYGSVKHNLNTIYRLRNNLVHNGSDICEGIDYYTRRLQMYLSNTLGILIFLLKKNPELTIVEVLYSIEKTYDLYYEQVTALNKVIEKNKKKRNEKIKTLGDIKKDSEEYKEIERELNISFTEDIRKNNIHDIVYPKYLYI